VEVVESCHCCSAAGIRPDIMFVRLMTNFGSHTTYMHCATETHYLEYRKMSLIRTCEMNLILMIKLVEINSNTGDPYLAY
jgi:hypothetical protein